MHVYTYIHSATENTSIDATTNTPLIHVSSLFISGATLTPVCNTAGPIGSIGRKTWRRGGVTELAALGSVARAL